MTRQEAIEYLREKAFQDYSGTPYEMAIEAIEKVTKYEKLERTGKLIRIPNCRNCKHAYKDDSRCYECIANMTC